MPLHARLAAAFLLIFPLISFANDAAVPASGRLKGGGFPITNSRPPDVNPRRIELEGPPKPFNARAVVNLKERPDTINKHDESLLFSVGYLIKDGLIRKAGGKPLRYGEIFDVLRKLREARKEKVLAEIAKIQREAEAGGSDTLSADQAKRLSALMKSDWAVIPPEIRSGLNEWLSDSGAQTVRAPDLRRALRSVEHWQKGLFAAEPPPLSLDKAPLSGDMPKAWPPWNTWSPVHPLPTERERARRMAAMNRATYIDPQTGEEKRYPERVREALIEVVRYASDRDGAAFVTTIQTLKPPIYVSNEKMAVAPFSGGYVWLPSPGMDSKEYAPQVVLPDYDVLIPDPEKGAVTNLSAYHPSNYTKLGLPVPDVQALDPGVEPKRVTEDEYRRNEIMPDGSVRSYWKSPGISALLLHEVLHLDTYRIGAGGHSFTNEMRSFNAMNRLWFNQAESKGWTRSPEFGNNWTWFRNPRAFRQDILKLYTSPKIAVVRPGEETVAGLLVEVERKLALGPELFENVRRTEVERRFEDERKGQLEFVDHQLKLGIISKREAEAARTMIEAEVAAKKAEIDLSEFPYREYLLWQRARLRRDQQLEVEVALTDYRWHATRGLSYTPDIQGRAHPGSLPAAGTRK